MGDQKTWFRCAGLALLGAAAGASALPLPTLLPPDAAAARILSIHNVERAAVGSAPLVWDPVLAAGANGWARAIAASGRFEHSDRRARPGIGENLAMWPGRASVDSLVGLWAGEKRNFIPGLFPANSRTGNWLAVSHYTQMIWPTTTRVGCAEASGLGRHYLVCRYSPKGNADGRPVPAPRAY